MRKAVYQLFLGNLGSKVIGLLREVLTAALFGTGQIVAAYRISLTGILTPINFLTSDILNTAFVPKYKSLFAENEDKAQVLFYSLFGLFVVFAVLLSASLYIFTGSWINLLAPEIDKETFDLTVEMFHAILISIPFYLFSAIIIFLCMARNDFVPLSIRPVIQNVGMIAGALLTYYTKNLLFLAWGFTFSYIFFFCWISLRAKKQFFLLLPKKIEYLGIKEIMLSFWVTLRPLVILPFVLQGNIIVERMVASLISLSAISAVDYAKFITETLILMVSTPLAFAGLTHWSGLSFEDMRKKIIKMIPFLNLIAIPISVFIFVNSYSIVDIFYSRGEFNKESVAVTGAILRGLSIGLWAQVISYVMVKSLSAQMRNKSVMLITGISLVFNVLVNFLCYKSLGAFTLGLSNSIYSLVMLILSLKALKVTKHYFSVTWIVALGAFIYLALAQLLATNQSVYLTMVFQSLLAICFWGAWVLSFNSLRASIFDIYKSRK